MAYDLNTNVIKTYATKENLEKALAKLSISEHPHIVVRNDTGRWTAIFPFSNFERRWLWNDNVMGYLAFYAEKGFMTVG